MKRIAHRLFFSGMVSLMMLAIGPIVCAQDEVRLAVLDFELRDLTLLPDSPQELERAASVAHLLRQVLAESGDFAIVEVDGSAQATANVSVGYLFAHPNVAAKLGREFDAEFVAVGRLHKPSFLFAYLMVQLVETRSERLVGNYVIEIKGSTEKVLMGGVESLARQIRQSILAQ